MRQLYISLFAMAFAVVSITGIAHAIDKGETAPPFSLQSLDGEQISLEKLKGKVVYLDFWASWCGPCRFSLPFMNTLLDKFANTDVVVVAVNLDSDRSKAEKALSTVSPRYTVLLDPKGTVPAVYDPPKMPTSFVIDRHGIVAAVHEGFDPDDTREIESAIEEALKGK
jgi:peroxiredoxin